MKPDPFSLFIFIFLIIINWVPPVIYRLFIFLCIDCYALRLIYKIDIIQRCSQSGFSFNSLVTIALVWFWF